MADKFEIHNAAKNGDKLIILGLLEDSPRLALQKDLDGRTPLHWAVSAQKTDIVKLLLNPSEIDVELTSGKKPSTTLDKKKKKIEIDIDDQVDDAGWTPLHIAVSVGNYNITKLLLDHEPHPDVETTTSTGLTLLHLATSKKHTQIVELLLKEYKESARVKDKRGQYPLHRAASVGAIAILELLITVGKSPLNAKDSSGWTPMHHALLEGNGDIAVLLVKLGADPKVEDSEGLTPLQVSVDEKVAKYFEKTCQETLGIRV